MFNRWRNGTTHRDRGASMIEYGALLVLVAALVGALTAVGLPGKVRSHAESAICEIFHGQSCGIADGGTSAQGNNGGNNGNNGGNAANNGGGANNTGANNTGGANVPADNLQLAAYNMPDPGVPGGGGDAGSQASRLPRGGNYPFVPKKGQSVDNPKSLTRKSGRFVDSDGNEWQWDPVKGEWDVQHKIPGSKKTSHTNVGEDGEITHGEDNFPRKPRPKGNQSGQQGDQNGGNDNKGSDTAKSVAVGAGILGVGGALWWGAKVLSPACGPFVIVCAIGL
jgi:hypothetical protein